MVVNDNDVGTPAGATITITLPEGYTTANRNCQDIPGGGVTCSVDIILLPSEILHYTDSVMGVITVPVQIAQGGLSRTVDINVTVTDEPELPSDVQVTILGPLLEFPDEGSSIARLVIVDPDTVPQFFAVALDTNPGGAFAIAADPTDDHAYVFTSSLLLLFDSL